MENENRKLLNKKISVEELENISKIIVKKALRVMATSTSSLYIHKLIEYKDIDTIKDLEQEVASQIIIDDYIVTKNSFKIVRKYLYNNYEKTELEIFSTEEEEEKSLDNVFYISYLNNNNEEIKKSTNFNIDMLELTEKQKEIINMYANGTSCRKIAQLLNISSVGTVSNTIKRIKQKAVKLNII